MKVKTTMELVELIKADLVHASKIDTFKQAAIFAALVKVEDLIEHLELEQESKYNKENML